MNRSIRTALMILVPLLVASVAAQATTIPYDFGASVAFTCATSIGSCAVGGSGGGTTIGSTGAYPTGTPGSANLYATEQARSTSTAGGNITLTWSGTGDPAGSDDLYPTVPVSWDFSISPVGGTTAIQWYLELVLNPGASQVTTNVSGLQTQVIGQPDIGSFNSPTGTLNGQSLVAWQAILVVDWSYDGDSDGNGAAVSIPAGTGLELGTVPEPSTWGQAGGGLLFALTMACRKLRRRS